MDILNYFRQQQIKDVARPHLRPGDVVRIETKITEAGKTRLQTFEGTVLGVRGSGPSATITVRRLTGGFAVERILPLYSPLITTIEITKRQKVRRAKLTYLRHAGRRRVKEDVEALQKHRKVELDKKRLAQEAKRRQAEQAEKEAKAKAVAETKVEAKPEQAKL